MIRFDLAGRTALVTGAASGVGFATAKILGSAGAAVAVNFLPDDNRGQEAVRTLKAQGIDAVEAPGDVGDQLSAERMVNNAVNHLGRLDLLVNNAGTPATRKSIPAPALDLLTKELWEAVLTTNLLSVFFCSRAAAPALKASRGAVVSTASLSGINAEGSSIAYSATKAGVINLTKGLARALAPDVRVNAVAPGSVVGSAWMVEWTEEDRMRMAQRSLLKTRCKPEDIAEVIVFLGVGASMMTGQTVVVDAGASLS